MVEPERTVVFHGTTEQQSDCQEASSINIACISNAKNQNAFTDYIVAQQ